MDPIVAVPAAPLPSHPDSPTSTDDARLLREALAALEPLLRVVPSLQRGLDGVRPGSTVEFEACLVTLGAVLARAQGRALATAAVADARVPVEATPLTRREHAVVVLLGEGLCNKEIAERLTISLHTVKTHVHNVLEKLQLRSRLEVAAFSRWGEALPSAC